MRESFMSQGFLPPAQSMIPDSNLHQGANFTLPNNLQQTIASNAFFLEQAKSGLLGDRNQDGIHQGNGLIGRAQTQKANESYIQKTEERQQELKNQRDRTILNSIENIESLSFDKKNNDIIKATGISDADEAIKQYESALQSMGFNNLKHFAEVYGAFHSGTIQPGTPRHTQLKELFRKNDKFINGAISAFDAIEAYNRRSINPLTQQDRIDLAKEGLQTGYYQNVNQALFDLKNRDEYITKDAKNRVNSQKFATQLHFSPSESSNPNRQGTNLRGGNSNFLSSRSNFTSKNFIPNNEENTEEVVSENNTTPNIQINPDLAKGYGDTFLPKSKDIIISEVKEENKNRNIFGHKIRERTQLMPTFIEQSKILSPIMKNNDKFKLNETLTPLVRDIQDYETISENNSKEFLAGKVPNNLNESAKQVKNILQNIQETKTELEQKDKEIQTTNNKELISEWNNHKKELISILNKTEKEYKEISTNYSKVDKNFLEPSQQSQNNPQGLTKEEQDFQNTILNGFKEGKSIDSLAQEAGFEVNPINGKILPNKKNLSIQELKKLGQKTKGKIEKIEGIEDLNTPAVIALTMLEPIVSVDSFRDIKNIFMENKASQPSVSQIKELIEKKGSKNDVIAKAFGRLFNGKGELLFKNQEGINYSKFINMLRIATTNFISQNKFDKDSDDFYAYILGTMPEEYQKLVKKVDNKK